MAEHDYRIVNLAVALDVIEIFLSSGSDWLGVSELSRLLRQSKSRVFRILNTLAERGYMHQDPQTEEYRLGLGFLVIGEAVRNQLNLRRIAEPILEELADMCGDAANLLVLFGHSAVCIDHRTGRHRLQAPAPIAVPFPLHIGASPKLLLAHLREEKREQIIQQIERTPYTSNTIIDRDHLRKVLSQIREQGYSIDDEEFEVGVSAIGAPVRDYAGNVIAGVTVTVPGTRYNRDKRDGLILLVVEAANRLSADLGYRVREIA